MQPNFECSSYRNSARHVLLRASDDPDVVQLFEHDGTTYDVVVALDTKHRRVRVSTRESTGLNAFAICEGCFGAGSEGNARFAISPEGTLLDISDAWNCAVVASRNRPNESPKMGKEAIKVDHHKPEEAKGACRRERTEVRIQQPSSSIKKTEPGDQRQQIGMSSVPLISRLDRTFDQMLAGCCLAVGYVLITLAVWSAVSYKYNWAKGHDLPYVVLLVSLVMGALGEFLRRYGKRLVLKNYGQTTSQVRSSSSPRSDHYISRRRGMVLLLRAFTDDKVNSRIIEQKEHHLGPLGSGVYTRISFEELIAEELIHCGDLITIGRPGEVLPPLGAKRIWVENDDWRVRVNDYLKDCALVVMVMGHIHPGDGLDWELQQVLENVSPEKLMFLMPPVDEPEAETRWSIFCDQSGRMPTHFGRAMAIKFHLDWLFDVIRNEPEWPPSAEAYRKMLKPVVTSCVARQLFSPHALRGNEDGHAALEATTLNYLIENTDRINTQKIEEE